VACAHGSLASSRPWFCAARGGYIRRAPRLRTRDPRSRRPSRPILRGWCASREADSSWAAILILKHRLPMKMGIRVALGADRGMITKMILRETGWLVFFGVSIGLAVAYGVSRYVQSMLYGVAAQDFTTFAGAVSIIIAVAAVAGYLPARRAARIDPVVALRHD
jgi:FtsX-like permease family